MVNLDVGIVRMNLNIADYLQQKAYISYNIYLIQRLQINP